MYSISKPINLNVKLHPFCERTVTGELNTFEKNGKIQFLWSFCTFQIFHLS